MEDEQSPFPNPDPDDFELDDRDLDELLEEMPETMRAGIEDQYGEVTKETIAKAGTEFFRALNSYAAERSEIDAAEYELSPDRE